MKVSCESLKLSRGDAITIVYSPDNPNLIARPYDVGTFPGTGVAAAIVLGLVDLALLVCCIFWVKHEKNIISPLLPGRKRADSRRRRKAEQVISTRPTASIYVKDEKWPSEQEQPEPSLAPESEAFQSSQASQLELFEASTQNEQEEEPSEQ